MKFRPALVVVVAALVTTGCGSTADTSPSDTPVASAEVAPTATPTPTAATTPSSAAGLIPFTWSEVTLDGKVAAVAGDGSRFVAVGSGTDGTASWTSTDGMNWEEHIVPDRSFGEVTEGVELRAGMGQPIRLGDTLYSFGGAMFMDGGYPAAWRWTDGGTWEVIESNSEFFAGMVIAVTASDEALLAATVAFSGPRGTPSTWLWTPASSWIRTGLTPAGEVDTLVTDVAWSAGRYVAIGSVTQSLSDPSAQPVPSIWTSTGGRDWTAIQPLPGASSFCSITALPTGGFVAFGTIGERAASWMSVDGDHWVEGTIEAPSEQAVEAARPCSVVAFDGGLAQRLWPAWVIRCYWSATVPILRLPMAPDRSCCMASPARDERRSNSAGGLPVPVHRRECGRPRLTGHPDRTDRAGAVLSRSISRSAGVNCTPGPSIPSELLTIGLLTINIETSGELPPCSASLSSSF